MVDHLVLCVDHIVTPKPLHSLQGNGVSGSPVKDSCPHPSHPSTSAVDDKEVGECSIGADEKPLIQSVECRICQEEDRIESLEIPCACNGSLKFAHRKCVQRWCNEKGDITCEICHQPYQSGYNVLPPSSLAEDTVIDVSAWTVSGTPLDLHNPRLSAMAAAEHHLPDTGYDEDADTSASGAAFCRSSALILMALLLLRHAVTIKSDDEDDDASTFLSLFLLRAAGFLLSCYVMAWAISILQHRTQRQVRRQQNGQQLKLHS